MKHNATIRTWRTMAVVFAAVLAMLGLAWKVGAEDLVIQSFDATGRLTFNNTPTAKGYRVEWAPSPAGPWTNFPAAAAALNDIAAPDSGSVTCSVPMCYRVMAVVDTNMYLVVNISGGTNAASYPVTYLPRVPPGGWTDAYKTTNLVLRRIQATTPNFTMGWRDTDYPGAAIDPRSHLVTLTKDFYLGLFEVTQRQWELVMGAKPSYFTNTTYYQTRPVDQVSYLEIRENPLPVGAGGTFKGAAISPNWPATNAVHANSFMGKLRAKTGLAGFDLPTESQWEYACRAGTLTALNSGQDLTITTTNDPQMDLVGRYKYNSDSTNRNCSTSGGTAKVGSYLPNQWGFYDMHGNVLEWCLDIYGSTNPGTVTDPKGPTGSNRVRRGGCWSYIPANCISGTYSGSDPSYRSWPLEGAYGFRVSCAPPDQP